MIAFRRSNSLAAACSVFVMLLTLGVQCFGAAVLRWNLTPQEIAEVKNSVLPPISQALSAAALERYGQSIGRLMIIDLERQAGGGIQVTATFDLQNDGREFQATLIVSSRSDADRDVEVQSIEAASASPLSAYAEFCKRWSRPSNVHEELLKQWGKNFAEFNVDWLSVRLPAKEFKAVYGTESAREASAVDRKGWPRFEFWQIASLRSSNTIVYLRLQRVGKLMSIDRAIVDEAVDGPTVVSWISLDNSPTLNADELACIRPFILQWIIDTLD